MKPSVRTAVRYLAIALSVFLTAASADALDARLTNDTSAELANPDMRFGRTSTLAVGNGTNAFLRFDFSTLPAGTVGSSVAKATLVLWISAVTRSGQIDVSPVIDAWNEETLTWNTRPAVEATPAATFAVSSAVRQRFVVVDVTAIVREWLDGATTNRGIALVASAATPDVSVQIDSKENTATSHEPRLQVALAARGDIASVSPGAGLAGGGATGAVTLTVAPPYRLPQGCAGNQVPRWNGSLWVCADVSGGGDVTAVTAGAGLTGGGTSGDVTIGVATGGIIGAMIGTDSVATQHIIDGSIMAADVGFNYAASTSRGGAATGLACTGCIRGSHIQDGSLTGNEISSSTTLTIRGLTVGSGPVTIANGNDLFRVDRRMKIAALPDTALLTSGGNLTPEVYRVGGTCERGTMFVARVSGDDRQDALCVCLRDYETSVNNTFCFQP